MKTKKYIGILLVAVSLLFCSNPGRAQTTAHCDSVHLTLPQIVALWGSRYVPDTCGIRETFGSFVYTGSLAGKQFALPYYPTASTLAPSNGFSVVPFKNLFLVHRVWELRMDSISAAITGKGGTGSWMDFNDAVLGSGRGGWAVYDDGGSGSNEFLGIDSVNHTTQLGNKKGNFILFGKGSLSNENDTIKVGLLSANRKHSLPDTSGTLALLLNTTTYYESGVRVGGGNGSGIRVVMDSVGVVGTTATFNITQDAVPGGTALLGTIFTVVATTRGGAVGNTVLSIAADKKSIKVTTGAGAAECYISVVGK